jgi:acetylornithine deacetylase/succinyl-diaminopimelate desuccinylase family protein
MLDMHEASLPPETISRIRNEIDRHAGDALGLLQSLVSINSINPQFPGIARDSVIGGETRCTRAIGSFLNADGLETHVVAPDPQRENLVAILRGEGGGSSLIINGHVDTVAPFKPESWSSGDPWSPVIRDGRLYGLGSTDMKGGLAAACLALRAVRSAGIRLKGDVQLHAVVGEETMSHGLGTSAVIEAGYRADAAIVVEPSSQPEPLTVSPVTAGNFNLRINVRGKGTHAGNRAAAIRPGGEGASAGVNAVEKLIKIVTALQELEQEWGISKSHPAFPAGFFSMVPGVFHGDVGVPSVGYMADSAYVGYLVWYPPNETPEAIKAEIENHVLTASRLDPWLRENPPEFEWLSNWPVADVPADHPLVKTLVEEREGVVGSRPDGLPKTSSFNAVCDASFLQAAGIPAVTFGPGNIRVAHAIDENIVLDEWKKAAEILARTIVRWCGTAV